MQTSQASLQLFLGETKAQMQPLLLMALWEQIFAHHWLTTHQWKKDWVIKRIQEIVSEAD